MNRAKQIRLDRRMGAVEAASGAGISRPTLKRIEDGENVIAASLVKLADFYEVNPSELLMPAIAQTREAA